MRVVVLGNSGSGKSTFARILSARCGLFHLDLDSIAWADDGVRQDPEMSLDRMWSILRKSGPWVVEGSYGMLVAEVCKQASHLVFLNPGVETCLENCRKRPWEKHKYPSREAQDANLDMLLAWARDYPSRDDEFSLAAHSAVFESFAGVKRETKSNAETHALIDEWCRLECRAVDSETLPL